MQFRYCLPFFSSLSKTWLIVGGWVGCLVNRSDSTFFFACNEIFLHQHFFQGSLPFYEDCFMVSSCNKDDGIHGISSINQLLLLIIWILAPFPCLLLLLSPQERKPQPAHLGLISFLEMRVLALEAEVFWNSIGIKAYSSQISWLILC